ncbi:COG4223 family protein [Rhizobium halophytocola]|uniref:Phage tail protein n=1 Tax=Rhizobium halophytocola TaxID=735519 RepID=A0ABS4E2U3_9HYPH|nr:COG4223 family protein [Rhizobium halophytocola]MBP1852266.1 hypothetical protein [Rhizobium halophytocola]
MASGKPPRRPKASTDPVTIDLEAEQNGPDKPDEGVKPEDLTADENLPISPDGDPVEAPPEKQSEPASSPAGLPFEDRLPHDEGTKPEDLTADEAFTPVPDQTPDTPVPPIASAEKGPGAAPLIASGIVGGIVALLLAGGMQYAGYLPSASSNDQSTSTSDLTADQNAKISSLEAKVAALSQTAGNNGGDSALAARVETLEGTVGQLGAAGSGDQQQAIDDLKTQIASLSTTLNEAQAAIATNKQTLDSTGTRLETAEQQLQAPSKDMEMARTIAVNSLKAAVDRGGPYLSELETLKSIAPDDAAIAGLNDHAKTGVPSRAELVRQFPKVADSILSAIDQPADGDSLGGRLMSSAMSLIKVRSVGNVEGEGADAIVARIEDKLHNGDMKGAELEWETLPDAGKQASQAFADKLKARIDVEAKIDDAMKSAIGANG